MKETKIICDLCNRELPDVQEGLDDIEREDTWLTLDMCMYKKVGFVSQCPESIDVCTECARKLGELFGNATLKGFNQKRI